MTIRAILCLAASCVAACLALAGTAAAAIETQLCAFGSTACPTGAWSYGALVRDASGDLYGTTSIGGTHNAGVVFELSPSGGGGWTETVLYSFCAHSNPPTATCTDGATPLSQLVLDVNGNLYGTVAQDGPNGDGNIGIVFELSPTTPGHLWNLTRLHSFCTRPSCVDGEYPGYAGLTYAGASTGALYDGTSPLYGVTLFGGANDWGTVYRLTPNTGGGFTHKVIYDFGPGNDPSHGGAPTSSLTVDGSGNLYGSAGYGLEGGGVVYELSGGGNSWTYADLYNFCSNRSLGSCFDGEGPSATVLIDAGGNILGTTSGGGSYSYTSSGGGTAFELLNPSVAGLCTYGSITELCINQLVAFCQADANCSDGIRPSTGIGLTLGPNGDYFGTTDAGGTGIGAGYSAGGTVYRIKHSLTHETVIYNFCSLAACNTVPADGNQPEGGLILDGAGNFYGTTVRGGTGAGFNGGGMVFELMP
jgi:uncharacterized repeat protein (TIGR03803 family)